MTNVDIDILIEIMLIANAALAVCACVMQAKALRLALSEERRAVAFASDMEACVASLALKTSQFEADFSPASPKTP